MKEELYKLPLIDAMKSGDECPFCHIERELEKKSLDYILGTSYMESDVREKTDKAGFCRYHFKLMFDYGNAQGNGLILSTHYKQVIAEFKKAAAEYTPKKAGIKEKLPFGKKSAIFAETYIDPVAEWARKKDISCYFCDYYRESYERYFDTFFYLYKKEPEFKTLLTEGKGFCLHHFGQLIEASRLKLSETEHKDFTDKVFALMEENMRRMEADILWFCDKFDYKNKDADWKNSRDALCRGMQKLRGLNPADAVYKQEK